MSQVLRIEMADDVLVGLQKEPKQLAAEMRIAAAVKWYEMGALSQGKAAEVAGLSRAAFIDELSRFGVSPFQESAEEILESVRVLSQLPRAAPASQDCPGLLSCRPYGTRGGAVSPGKTTVMFHIASSPLS